jgi:hypothetical protein
MINDFAEALRGGFLMPRPRPFTLGAALLVTAVLILAACTRRGTG